MDSYAALDQYEGLTMWFLSDALAHWPNSDAARSPIPADHSEMLVNDLHSSGLAWGRSDNVWWELSGKRTAADPRYDQGLVDVKVETAAGWRDLLALRPEQTGLSSAWTLTMPGGETATPTFTSLRGTGHHVVLAGSYRETSGKVVAPAIWRLTTTEQGVKLAMTLPHHATMRTTIWQPENDPILSARAATAQQQACTVVASGQACPTTLRWTHGNSADLEIGA
jgi:hypothetical protein